MTNCKLPRIITVLLVAAFITAGAGILFGKFSERGFTVFTDSFIVIHILLAALLALIVFRTAKKASLDKKFWMLQSIVMFLLLAAGVSWGFYEVILNIETPWISAADIFWTASYIFQFAALIYLIKNMFIEKPYIYLSAALGIVSAILLYFLFINRIVLAGDVSIYEKAVSIMYSALDILSAAICLPILITSLKSGAKVFKPILLIAVGYTIVAIYDSAYYYLLWHTGYSSGNPLDILYLLFYALLGLAAYCAYNNLCALNKKLRREMHKNGE